MNKLRFPSRGSGGQQQHQNGVDHPTNSELTVSNDHLNLPMNNNNSNNNKKQTRHVSPFRQQRKESIIRKTTEESAKFNKPTSRSSKGKVRWLVNASSDLVKSATTLKKTVVSKPTENSQNNSGGSSSIVQQDDDSNGFMLTKDNKDLSKSSNMDNNHNLSYLPTLSPPRHQRKDACDPEETLSVGSGSTHTRSNTSNRSSSVVTTPWRPPPLLLTETVELNVYSSSPKRTGSKYSSLTPPDPEGLELWTTPTKSTSASSFDDDASSLGSADSKDSGLVLFGDNQDDDEEEDLTQSHASHDQAEEDTVDESESDDLVSMDDAKTEPTFQSAAATVQSNTAEEAARGACADLAAAHGINEDHEEDEEAEARQRLEETLKIDVSMDADIGQDDDDDDDYTYTPSLAPSAGFDTISPSCCGYDGSTVGGGREGSDTSLNNSKASPPKEVLAMKSSRSVSGHRSIPEEQAVDDGVDDTAAAAKEEEIRTAREMAANLLEELEAVRGENERIISRTRRLQTQLQELKIHQEENLIQRSRLIKACLYISPIFILCGGLDVFCISILLVWVLVEVESYMELGEEKSSSKSEEDVDNFEEDKEPMNT
ncbi:hypothetical protein IV203_010508 [Nitzschia inconspicua]|uniref:Uncharacterized protein n=1 Tax=Nitzschia inconspicua TaxID=303405 RepID=A0A9K3PKY6_9STRA|nr:hypothetical protein IV203_010508 [Nitzschia inconspicua]